MGAVRVEGLGKAYKQYPTHWARLAEWVLPVAAARPTLHWVLRDISFRIAPGEAVGIIGINGAGKSTLLKIITGTTQPTTGHVELTGSIAAMLELGIGFHPDFTGRQNVLMAGQLLGMTVEELAQRMPEIERFAEIGEYIDQPVRVYSSGMQMRLAFSVATARRPDILIVDEALSVGDAYFQHKSFDRIRDFGAAGTTLLIVSHDKQAIQSICDRAILLDGGRLAKEGAVDEVVDYYNALIAAKEASSLTVEQRRERGGWLKTRSGTGEASLDDLQLLDAASLDAVQFARVGQALVLRARVVCRGDIKRLVLGLMLRDRVGHVVWGSNTWHTGQMLEELKDGDQLNVDFAFVAELGPGSYGFTAALHETDTHIAANFDWQDNALVFEVVNADKPTFIGSNWLKGAFSISRLPRSGS